MFQLVILNPESLDNRCSALGPCRVIHFLPFFLFNISNEVEGRHPAVPILGESTNAFEFVAEERVEAQARSSTNRGSFSAEMIRFLHAYNTQSIITLHLFINTKDKTRMAKDV